MYKIVLTRADKMRQVRLYFESSENKQPLIKHVIVLLLQMAMMGLFFLLRKSLQLKQHNTWPLLMRLINCLAAKLSALALDCTLFLLENCFNW